VEVVITVERSGLGAVIHQRAVEALRDREELE